MTTGISAGALAVASSEVLERMFFTDVMGDSEASRTASPDCLCAALGFQGEPYGSLRLEISRPAARSLAANFLGVEREEDLADGAIGEVVCELANMICGNILSRQGNTGTFDLSAPRLLDPAAPSEKRAGIGRKFELENGDLTVFLEIGEAHA